MKPQELELVPKYQQVTPNCFTMEVVGTLKEFLERVEFEGKKSADDKKHENALNPKSI